MQAPVSVTVLVTASLLALAPAAAAQPGSTNPFTPGLPSSPAPVPAPTQPTTTPTIITAPTTTGGGSLSGGGVFAIAIGALVMLGGISFFIWRDARRRAPVRHAHADASVGARSGSKARPKPRKLSQAERRRRKRGRAR